MNRNSFVAGIALAVLAVFLILLLTGGWNGMMGTNWGHGWPEMMSPNWTISPMGGTMSVGVGGIFILLAGTFILAALVIWAVRNLKK